MISRALLLWCLAAASALAFDPTTENPAAAATATPFRSGSEANGNHSDCPFTNPRGSSRLNPCHSYACEHVDPPNLGPVCCESVLHYCSESEDLRDPACSSHPEVLIALAGCKSNSSSSSSNNNNYTECPFSNPRNSQRLNPCFSFACKQEGRLEAYCCAVIGQYCNETEALRDPACSEPKVLAMCSPGTAQNNSNNNATYTHDNDDHYYYHFNSSSGKCPFSNPLKSPRLNPCNAHACEREGQTAPGCCAAVVHYCTEEEALRDPACWSDPEVKAALGRCRGENPNPYPNPDRPCPFSMAHALSPCHHTECRSDFAAAYPNATPSYPCCHAVLMYCKSAPEDQACTGRMRHSCAERYAEPGGDGSGDNNSGLELRRKLDHLTDMVARLKAPTDFCVNGFTNGNGLRCRCSQQCKACVWWNDTQSAGQCLFCNWSKALFQGQCYDLCPAGSKAFGNSRFQRCR